MAENLDSYFFVGDNDRMQAWCADCRNEKKPDQGWFWSGNKGYGPYDIKCHACSKYIHKVEKNDNRDKKKKVRKAARKAVRKTRDSSPSI